MAAAAAILSLEAALAGRRLSPATVRVYRHLESIADSEGIVEGASQEALAFGARVSSVTIVNATADLEAAGYLAIEHTGGRGKTNRYRLLSAPTA